MFIRQFFLTKENEIALCGFMMTGILLHYHFRGAFAVTLIFCSVVSWVHSRKFPGQIAEAPVAPFYNEFLVGFDQEIGKLALSLFFLYIICLNGLSRVSQIRLYHILYYIVTTTMFC